MVGMSSEITFQPALKGIQDRTVSLAGELLYRFDRKVVSVPVLHPVAANEFPPLGEVFHVPMAWREECRVSGPQLLDTEDVGDSFCEYVMAVRVGPDEV